MASLGIDIGTQSLKAAVLDDDLKLLATADSHYQPDYPRPGWAEQSSQVWLDALRPVIGDALAKANLAPQDVRAVAVCGQLDGCIPVDVHGEALSPAIIWMDRRATEELSHIDAELVALRCGLVLDASHMAAKIAWFSRQAREFNRVAMWHQPVSFVVAAITGEGAISRSLASTTMLYGIEAQNWDTDLLDAFGVDLDTLPRVAGEADIAGSINARGAELTGLLPGTRVSVGTGDDFSNLLGSGVCSPGVVAVSLGTAETVGALSDRAIFDPELLVETHVYPGGQFHLGNPGWLSGGAVRWASSLLSVGSDEAFSALAATAPAGCEGLTFIPALTGAMAPKWIASARGSFIGLSTSHQPAHLARAVLEGTAFAMRDVIDRLDALNVPTGHLRLVGGGARSALWCQIRADVAGRPISAQAGADASAIGAGLIAAVTSGIVPDIRSASLGVRHTLREVAPDSSRMPTYETAYHAYHERFAALESTWPKPN